MRDKRNWCVRMLQLLKDTVILKPVNSKILE